MEMQICEIKKVSRSTGTKTTIDTLHNFLLKNLNRSVTFKALDLIKQELEYVSVRGTDRHSCGCYMRRTHGLPCACELQYWISNQYSIPLSEIHEYWKKLDIDFSTCYEDAAESAEYYPLQRNLFGETTDICAPPESQKPDKPKKLTGVRVPSAWERIKKACGFKDTNQKKGAGRVAGIRETQAGSPSPMSISRNSWSSGQNMNSWSSGHNMSPPSQNTPTSRAPKTQPSNLGRRQSTSRRRKSTTFSLSGSVLETDFPPYIIPFIDSVTNVIDDGNCGFRAVALAIYGDQEQWKNVRTDLITDLQRRTDLYNQIFHGNTTVDELIERIDYFDSDPAPRRKWMSVPDCGHVIATYYNVVFMTFGPHGGNTCLPAILDGGRGPPINTLVLGHVHRGSHWVLVRKFKSIIIFLSKHIQTMDLIVALNLQLHMYPGDYPVPPLALYWEQYHDDSVHGIDSQFANRIATFNRLHDLDAPRRQLNS